MAGFQEFEWSISKIFGEPDQNGFSTAQQFSISRHSRMPNGQEMKNPWRLQIVNGRGIKVKNKNGGAYMQSGSFQMEKSAFIQLTDMDLYLLLKRVDVYVTEWEHCIAPPLLTNGKALLVSQQAQRQQQFQQYPYAA